MKVEHALARGAECGSRRGWRMQDGGWRGFEDIGAIEKGARTLGSDSKHCQASAR